ncbi:MAG TPA: PadR family transcriptional regulator [Anaerolineae bacterium]|nr:PadR family transcriptional regulator [Anaerolineae bacterium]
MYPGRGRGGGGAGWGRRGPHRARRFLEPTLLLLLAQGDAHGYDLVARLQALDVDQPPPDSSMIYRSLRQMEADGLVVSAWDTTGSGPPRRVYCLTPDGRTALAWWIEEIRRQIARLQRLLDAYETTSTTSGE